MGRKILHSDADCFYAAVETRDCPSYRGRPLAVGGSADRRGVIATCNYEARAYGVHSAMSSAHALRLCPHLILVPGRMDVYRTVSRQIFDIYRDFSEQIEPLSLDEAYIDVSDCPAYQGSATRIAEAIRARVRSEVGLTVSVGVAPNKFLAKVASDWDKPDGLHVITPDRVDAFVEALPVTKLHGVGSRTSEKLHAWGLYTCGDIRRHELGDLLHRFGKLGRHLFELAHGRDDRPVRSSRIRKSISTEQTYAEDLADLAACERELPDLLTDLDRRFERLQGYSIQGAMVKVKFSDFTQTTVEQTARDPTADVFHKLLVEGWHRRGRPVRLLGVGYRVRHVDDKQGPVQLSLWDSMPPSAAVQSGPEASR